MKPQQGLAMDLRQLTPDLAVSPQIAPEDVQRLADAGFKVLINNRPDAEITPDIDHKVFEDAAKAAGMEYHYLPFTPGQITPELISGFGQAISGEQPVFAYCRSGNRSTVLWALNQAGKLPETDILETAAKAGYDLSGLRPLRASLTSNKG